MIYLIDGSEQFLIEEKIKELTKGGNTDSVFRYDGNDRDFSISEIVSACDSYNLLSEEKYVLVFEPPFLTGKTKEEKDAAELEELLRYCKNPAFETVLIFYTYTNAFQKNIKTFKEIASNAEVITLNGVSHYDFRRECTAIINSQKLNISDDALNRLILMSDYSLTAFINNLKILKNYPSRIDLKCVEKLCTGDISSSVFDLINALVAKNTSKALSVLNRMCEYSNAFAITGSLANQLRFLYQVMVYKKQGYSVKEVSQFLKAREFAVERAFNSVKLLDEVTILNLLSELSKTDVLNKKDSSVSPEERLRLFILKNFRSNNESR